jgi:long-chain acyl-CoA synthetase
MSLAISFTTISELFDAITTRYAESSRPLLRYKSEGQYKDISYREFRRRVEHCTCGLASLGVQRGDNILMLSENRPEWVIADMGMVHLGAVNVPIFPSLTPKQVEYILQHSESHYAIVSNQMQLNKVLKVSAQYLKKIIVMSDLTSPMGGNIISFSEVLNKGEEFHKAHPTFFDTERKKIKADDLLTIIYTSGTTGNPKGVMLTHSNLVSNIRAAAECIPITDDDVLLSFLPLCHSYERMAGYYTALACGATIAYAESVETVRDNMLETHPTIITTVPRLFERIHSRIMRRIENSSPLRRKIFYWAIAVGKRYAQAKKQKSISTILQAQRSIAEALVFKRIKEQTGGRMKYFVSGGAALSRELGEFFEAIGIQIIEGYGLTETSPVISVNRLDDYKFGTVGKPIPGVEVKIADDGEILARGPNIMKGYWKDQQATSEMIDKDGWLHTGDIGMIDSEGFLHITDRKKHLFVNSGGKNIAPQPIENLFVQSPLIDQFVLIGDSRMFCTALVVPDFDALKEICQRNGISFSSDEDLVGKREVYELYEKEINALQKDLANFERVRKFTLLPKPLSLENGEITPKLNVRRKVVEERYKDIIEKMYAGVS